jgi:uncharacterized protein (TIGR03435 family)
MTNTALSLPGLVVLLSVTALSQPLHAQPASFEVASIKPNNSGSGTSGDDGSPGRWTARNVTTMMVIQKAFNVKDFQISGGPGWLGTDRCDIAATTGTSTDMTDQALRPYLESLLTDRFQLKYHREMKEFQVYSLVAANSGPKLTVHSGEGGSHTNVSRGSGKADINAIKVSLAKLASILSGLLDRIVIDNTGLKGEFDLKLEWAPNPAADSGEPSLFTALQEQLGLKLESTKGPVEIVVIDNLEKPSEN